jgi:hypothetical protein
MMDWDQLLMSGPDRSLDSLELDVRRAVEARRFDERRTAILVSAQAGLVAMSIFGSLVWGGFEAGQAAAAGPLGVFSPNMALAPSSRLGDRTP